MPVALLPKSTTNNLVTYLELIFPLVGTQLVRLVLFIVTALHSAGQVGSVYCDSITLSWSGWFLLL
jgi:hypothetical protein